MVAIRYRFIFSAPDPAGRLQSGNSKPRNANTAILPAARVAHANRSEICACVPARGSKKPDATDLAASRFGPAEKGREGCRFI
jgi:hypothetical protein